jgi:hypothetical protein
LSHVHAHGLRLEPPAAWDVRIYRRPQHGLPAEERTYPIIHAATFPLPRTRGDYGSGAVELMRPTDVLVVLLEQDREATQTRLFNRRGLPTVLARDFSPFALQRTLRGQSGVQYFFQTAGRAFCLYVVIGSHARRGRLACLANQLVASMSVS